MSNTIVTSAVVSFVVAMVCGVLFNVLAKEAEGWLDLLPMALLRLALLRVQARCRASLYDEWHAELVHALRGVDGRPVTRLVIATKLAAGWLRSARSVAAALGPVREAEMSLTMEELVEQLYALRGQTAWSMADNIR